MSLLPTLTENYLAGIDMVRRAVTGMSKEQLRARPVPGKWSTLEVVCHLVDSDIAWIHRMERVIAEDHPLLLGYDESRFSAALHYQDRDVTQELVTLEIGRRRMARVLRTLSPETLKRTGVHSERGLLNLQEMIEIENGHIPHHVKFIHEKRKALGLPAAD